MPSTGPARNATFAAAARADGAWRTPPRSTGRCPPVPCAARGPRIRPEDWQYERTLAGALLSETRLYRQAAIQDGASDVARVMRDLEMVLLEASMSDKRDRTALERVQRLIAKRDLVVKMQVMATPGPAGNLGTNYQSPRGAYPDCGKSLISPRPRSAPP